MDRRDALKSLAALAGSTGMTITPVTAKDAGECALIILKTNGQISMEGIERIQQAWKQALKGTPLQGVRAIVVDSTLDVEFVRK